MLFTQGCGDDLVASDFVTFLSPELGIFTNIVRICYVCSNQNCAGKYEDNEDYFYGECYHWIYALWD